MAKLYILNGPDIGRSFDIEKDAVYIGRSRDNDIRVRDKTVSRRHLKVHMEGTKYLITDLKSQNGTFFSGNYLTPGIEMEVKEGTPIVIGMSVICLGKGCMEGVATFLDTIELTKAVDEQSGIFVEHREKTNQKKLDLIYKVSNLLMEQDIKETLKKVLDNIFELLKRIDRGVVIIIDPDTGEEEDIVYRYKIPGDDVVPVYCKELVDRVLEEEKAVMISDANEEPGDELADTLKSLRIRSVMCVPMMGISQIIGAIYVDSVNRPYGFRKEDLSLFSDIGKRTAVAIEHAFLASSL